MSAQGGDGWLQAAMGRLSAQGFALAEGVSCEGQTFAAVAHRSAFELSRFGNAETFLVLAEFDALDRASLRAYSARAFRYAMAHKRSALPPGLFESVQCFAVAIVDALDPAVAEAVRREAPPKHWACFEIPVVYERNSGALIFYEGTPAWGAAYYAGMRKQIRALLG